MLEGEHGFIHLLEILKGHRCAGFYHQEVAQDKDRTTSRALTDRKVSDCLRLVLDQFGLHSMLVVDRTRVETDTGICRGTWFVANKRHPLWNRVQACLLQGQPRNPRPLPHGSTRTTDPLDRELGPAFEFLPGGMSRPIYVSNEAAVSAKPQDEGPQRWCIFDRSVSVGEKFTKLASVIVSLSIHVPFAGGSAQSQRWEDSLAMEPVAVEIFRGQFAVDIGTPNLDGFRHAFARYRNLAASASFYLAAQIDWTGEWTKGQILLPPTDAEARASAKITALQQATRPPTVPLGISVFKLDGRKVIEETQARAYTKQAAAMQAPSTGLQIPRAPNSSIGPGNTTTGMALDQQIADQPAAFGGLVTPVSAAYLSSIDTSGQSAAGRPRPGGRPR